MLVITYCVNLNDKTLAINKDKLEKAIEKVQAFRGSSSTEYYYSAEEAAIRDMIPEMDRNCGYDVKEINLA